MSRPIKTLAVALALSLGLNLFLLGFWAARAWHKSHGPKRGDLTAGGLPHLFYAAKAFNDPQHPKLQRVIQSHKSKLLPRRQAVRKARREVDEALQADPFDKARLEAALANLRKETQTTQSELHSALLDLASEMTPEQRQELDQLNRRRGWRKR